MKTTALILMILCLAGMALATDLGNRMLTDKPAPQIYEPPNEPPRQGGDNILAATVIPVLPYTDTGTTAGYLDDYDELCPYAWSTSPDVVYAYTPSVPERLDIDLCGSSYDTKLYVYDESLNLVACNDDYYFGDPCGAYVSRLENVGLSGGRTYYIVIDGYGGDYGDYVLCIFPLYCSVICPEGAQIEGEPALVPGYADSYNGGCNSDPPAFQEILADAAGNAVFCGVSGWYQVSGSTYRDTDWFIIAPGPMGIVDIFIETDFSVYLYELGPQDCNSVGILQLVQADPCSPGEMTVVGNPNDPVWIWVGPVSWQDPAEFNYVMRISGASVIQTARETWGSLKLIYR